MKKFMTWKSWSESDDTFMLKNYKTMIVKDICKALNRTKASVVCRAKTLGLATNRKDVNFHNYISFKRRKEAGLLDETPLMKVKRQNINKIRWAKRHPDRKKQVLKKYNKVYILENPDKILARQIALRYYKLHNQCDICFSNQLLTRHHWRYDRPLLVNTLCLFCHDVQHGRRKYE